MALLLYAAMGVATPSLAVLCEEADGDRRIMIGGGCASENLPAGETSSHMSGSCPGCESPCVDRPIASDPTDLLGRSNSAGKHSAFPAVSAVLLWLPLDTYRFASSTQPPELDHAASHIRAVVLRI